MVDGQFASRGAVTEPVVADANFQVQLLADIVQHVATVRPAHQQVANNPIVIDKLGRRWDRAVVVTAPLPTGPVVATRLNLTV